MAQGLHRHHPDWALTVLLLDAAPDAVEAIPNARVLGLDAMLGEDAAGLRAAANAPGALPVALLAVLVREVLRSRGSPVVYLDAGERVLGALTGLQELLAEHPIVLVAQLEAPTEPTAAFADDVSRGAYSRHVLGFADDPAATALLASWPRLFRIADDDGAGAVRRWIDGIPAIAEGAAVLRDPTFAVDAPALAELAVSDGRLLRVEDESLLVGERQARLLDVGELDPGSPWDWFGRAEGGPALVSALGQIAELQARELREAGWSAGADEVPFRRLDDGLLLTDTIRTLIARAVADGRLTRSPFTAAGREQLYDYLREPGDRGRAAGLTRLHLAIWRSRADLRSAYRHLDGPDGAGLAGWMCAHGAEQEDLVAELLPPAPKVAYRDADPYLQEGEARWGVNVVGYFIAELGVGEAARLLVSGLDAAYVPVLSIQGNLMPPSRTESAFKYTTPDQAAFPVNILCINGDGIPVFAREAGRSFFESRYTIALWWWEAGEPPESWKRAYDFIDEVWVGARHVYDLLAPGSPVPVVHVRLPVVEPRVAHRSRSQLGMPGDGYLFLCVHDYHSVAARKNPAAVVQAYRRAFPDPGGARLIVKSINAATDPREHARVVLAGQGRDDIVLIDDYLSAAEKNAMIAAADCFVSLHRSEGFGIPLAEAMILGRPVIATRYGGSLEFMTDENSYLVDWDKVAVGEGAYPYSPKAEWAEPRLDHAAALMREVFEHPEQARERGRIAKRDLLERHSPAAAGEVMRGRLSVVREQLSARGEQSLNLTHLSRLGAGAKLRERIVEPPDFDWNHERLDRFKANVYHPVLKWVREYVKHQQGVDAEMARLVDVLDEQLRRVARETRQEVESRHAETLALLRRVEGNLGEIRDALDDVRGIATVKGDEPAD
jgi:glycosyltransferase involved in cell wall biosynthesis